MHLAVISVVLPTWVTRLAHVAGTLWGPILGYLKWCKKSILTPCNKLSISLEVP